MKRAAMCCARVVLWKSLSCLSVARRSNTGPRAAQWGGGLPLEAQVGVDAVLGDEEVAGDRQLGEAVAALRREVAPGGVLAGGLEHAQLHLVAGEHALERVDVEAVLVHRDPDHARARGA